MAQGKTITIKRQINNKGASVTQVTEPIVINGVLVADNNDINPGVNSRNQ
jgi:hypothetical protein